MIELNKDYCLKRVFVMSGVVVVGIQVLYLFRFGWGLVQYGGCSFVYREGDFIYIVVGIGFGVNFWWKVIDKGLFVLFKQVGGEVVFLVVKGIGEQGKKVEEQFQKLGFNGEDFVRFGLLWIFGGC